MPQSRIPLPHPVQPLHVYRHLLRAASYYPATIRSFLDERIRTGFRDERERAADSEPKIRMSAEPIRARENEDYRRKKHLLDGKKKIPFLQAASNGDQKRLRKLMWHVYGRLGKRRRELMASFVTKEPQPPLDAEQLRERMEQLERDRKKKEKLLKTHPWKRNWDREDPTPWVYQHLSPVEDNWDIPKLRAYVKAQQGHQRNTTGAAFPRAPIRNLDPMSKVPKEDVWGRPTAPRRVTKAVRKWWKWTADKTMPPVDKEDWDLLKLLGSGDAPKEMYAFPRRRRIAAPIGMKCGAQPEWDWAIHTRLPARDIERSRSLELARLTGQWDDGPYSRTHSRVSFAKHQPKTTKKPPVLQKQPFRTRQIRREYERMWEASSYMKPGSAPEGQKPVPARPIWGVKRTELPAATVAHQHLFKGVDAKGKRLQPSGSSAQKPKESATDDGGSEAYDADGQKPKG